MRLLGIDFGDARIGLALSDPTGYLASPAGTIQETDIERAAQKTAEKISELQIEKIILGYPKNMNGTEGARALRTRQFAELLREKTGLEVVLYDERCTTLLSHTILNATDTRGKKRKAAVDTLSACIILQNYLDMKK